MSEAGREAVCLRRLLLELGERQSGATTLHCDNQSAIHLGKNPATHQRTKLIDIRHHILRDLVENGSISLEYVRSANQLADILTKPLPRTSFSPMVTEICIRTPAESVRLVKVRPSPRPTAEEFARKKEAYLEEIRLDLAAKAMRRDEHQAAKVGDAGQDVSDKVKVITGGKFGH